MKNLSTIFSFFFPFYDYNRKLEVNAMILILLIFLFLLCYSGCVISSKCSREEEQKELYIKKDLISVISNENFPKWNRQHKDKL